ncbi:MAG: DUF4783 domain-containing protein [Chitinophagaceae bacterium]
MKNYLWLVLLFCLFMLPSLTPPPANTPGMEIEDVVGALKTGNATQLSRYFDIRVDITLPDKSDNYSKAQAEMIIRDFFGSNNVNNFEIKYKGENNGAKYCIGTLKTKNGDYRTKLFMKQKDNKQVLQELAFQTVE